MQIYSSNFKIGISQETKIKMAKIIHKLRGGDLRSIGRANEVVSEVLQNPSLFEQILRGILHEDPIVAMRSADVVEKVTIQHPEWLQPYKKLLLTEIAAIEQQEVRWHIAQMVPRLQFTKKERKKVAAILIDYLRDKSRIVQTFSLEALVHLAREDHSLQNQVSEVLLKALEEGSPAVKNRAKKLLKKYF